MEFDSVKKVYFLGIGGIGVSAIARMFLLEGKEVFGSDTSASEIIKELEVAGAKIFIGQDISHIPDDTDLVVYTIAIPHFAPDFFVSVKKKFKNVISYPEALEIISKNKYTIAISGTHGKTTTTAMVAKILIDAGFDPTVIVGSILADVHTNFIAGKSKYLVVEACEYQRSFLKIHPTIVGITTIDNDHLDYYKDENDIENAFSEFAGMATETIVADMSSPKILNVTAGKNTSDSAKFYDAEMKLKVPGEHNRRNASIALAIADHLGIPKEIAIKSLESFSGTWRRFEYKGKTKTGAVVYDDYAHHPTEIAATLSGAREMFPEKKITIVFQPHLYSRTKLLFADFAKALGEADDVILLPIYAAREEKDETVSSKLLAAEIEKKNPNVIYSESFEDAASHLLQKNENDAVMTMGAGDVYKISSLIL